MLISRDLKNESKISLISEMGSTWSTNLPYCWTCLQLFSKMFQWIPVGALIFINFTSQFPYISGLVALRNWIAQRQPQGRRKVSIHEWVQPCALSHWHHFVQQTRAATSLQGWARAFQIGLLLMIDWPTFTLFLNRSKIVRYYERI